jgi:hypothetical protein
LLICNGNLSICNKICVFSPQKQKTHPIC